MDYNLIITSTEKTSEEIPEDFSLVLSHQWERQDGEPVDARYIPAFFASNNVIYNGYHGYHVCFDETISVEDLKTLVKNNGGCDISSIFYNEVNPHYESIYINVSDIVYTDTGMYRT